MIDSLRRTRVRIISFFVFVVVVFGAVAVPHVLAQQSADTSAAAQATGSDGGLLLWDVIGKAGGFQYPIFAILAIGLFLIFAKMYELYQDRKAAEELEEASIADMDMKRITMLVANQEKSMLADLQATMLNVFQTTDDAGTLHEEIANFIQFQRERFETFTRRVNFLADTAGAVGLLGTVWGMFTLFYGGNVSDKQAILGGMGVALVSTLLGLVVSIILNLISTELYSFFDNRIDQIEEEADELRFRLMELNLSENGTQDDSRGDATAQTREIEREEKTRQETPTPEKVQPSRPEGARAGSAPVETKMKTSESDTVTTETLEPSPHRLEVSNLPDSSTVGSTIRDVRLKVSAEDGTPISDEPVRLQVENGSGELGDGASETSLRTNDEGIASFDWHLPEDAGTSHVTVNVPNSEVSQTNRRLSVEVQPGTPVQFEQDGNNQGADLGEEVPKPFVVSVFDSYGNPVPGQPVQFRVESGGGSFPDGEDRKEVSTGEDGTAAVEYAVGKEPGLNQVVASVGEEELEFQAMALEQ